METRRSARLVGTLLFILLLGLVLHAAPPAQAATIGRIRSNGTGLCVQAGTTNGSNASVQTCSTNANQRWEVTGLGGNDYRVRATNVNLCLGVNNANTGQPVKMRPCDNSNNVKWVVFYVTATGTFMAHSKVTPFACQQAYTNTSLLLAACNMGNNSQWFELKQF